MPLLARPASNRQTARHQDFFPRGIRLSERHCRPLRHLPCKIQTQSRLRNRRSSAPRRAFRACRFFGSATFGSSVSVAKCTYSPRFSPFSVPATAKLDPSTPRSSNVELIGAHSAGVRCLRGLAAFEKSSFTTHGTGDSVSPRRYNFVHEGGAPSPKRRRYCYEKSGNDSQKIASSFRYRRSCIRGSVFYRWIGRLQFHDRFADFGQELAGARRACSRWKSHT